MLTKQCDKCVSTKNPIINKKKLDMEGNCCIFVFQSKAFSESAFSWGAQLSITSTEWPCSASEKRPLLCCSFQDIPKASVRWLESLLIWPWPPAQHEHSYSLVRPSWPNRRECSSNQRLSEYFKDTCFPTTSTQLELSSRRPLRLRFRSTCLHPNDKYFSD